MLSNLINKRYPYIIFALFLLGLKFLFDKVTIPAPYLSLLTIPKMLFQVVYFIAGAHIILFIAILLIYKNKPREKWDNLQEKNKGTIKGKLIDNFLKGLMVSIPILLYGSLIYIAVFLPWKTIFIIGPLVIISNLFENYTKRKRQR